MPQDADVGDVIGIYWLGRKLGGGAFGDVYFAVNTQTRQPVAVKLESIKSQHPQLMYEAKTLRHLYGVQGIAKMHYCGVEGNYNIMVTDLLGPSLNDVFESCKRNFSLKTVLKIAQQLLYRIEYLHDKNFIHRDIKPDNVLIGRGSKSSIMHIIDFGLAKRYRDPKSHQHIPYSENKGLTGTACFASINAHLGIEQSRRDDLLAIGYVLMYFARGSLPWQGLKANNKEERHRKILECKSATSVEALCKGYPKVFATYLIYSMALSFEDRPDYAYLRRLFKDAMSDFSDDAPDKAATHTCGHVLAGESSFRMSCRTKFLDVTSGFDDAVEKVIRCDCGRVLEHQAKFCMMCGAKRVVKQPDDELFQTTFSVDADEELSKAKDALSGADASAQRPSCVCHLTASSQIPTAAAVQKFHDPTWNAR